MGLGLFFSVKNGEQSLNSLPVELGIYGTDDPSDEVIGEIHHIEAIDSGDGVAKCDEHLEAVTAIRRDRLREMREFLELHGTGAIAQISIGGATPDGWMGRAWDVAAIKRLSVHSVALIRDAEPSNNSDVQKPSLEQIYDRLGSIENQMREGVKIRLF